MVAESWEVRDLLEEAPTPHLLTTVEVEALAEELAAYHAHFAPCFTRSEQRAWADVYLRGLLIADIPRKNTEAMALRLLGAGEGAERHVRALQQFIGEGGWDDEAILTEHRRLVDQTLGEADGVLIVDESAVPKRGDHSAGVARQWCGARGKQENCQVGVFLGYASRKGYTLLDRRLYLPREWFALDHRERWEACHIPDATTFASKAELAGQVVDAAVQGGLRARWLTCDEWYGRDSAFLDRVAGTGLSYLAEVGKSTMVWPLIEPADGSARARPQAWVPPRNASGKGRTPVRVHLHPDSPAPLRVDGIAARVGADQWRRYRILEGARGPLVADFAALRAVAVRDGLPGPEVWLVLRRSLPAPSAEVELKFYLSNAPADTPLAALVRVSGLRWPIESCFEEGKEEVGLDQYELRFWRGWLHHMTLVILAHHFLVRLRQHLDPRGGAPTASDHADRRPGRLPGRPARVHPAPGAPAPAPARPNAAAGSLAAPGCPAAAHPRPGAGAGPRRLHPAPQPRGLLLPSQAHAPALGGPGTVVHVSLSY
ncbi:MAG: IS701-like element ISRba4 family transposase [Steroidobacteraceae bacterium]